MKKEQDNRGFEEIDAKHMVNGAEKYLRERKVVNINTELLKRVYVTLKTRYRGQPQKPEFFNKLVKASEIYSRDGGTDKEVRLSISRDDLNLFGETVKLHRSNKSVQLHNCRAYLNFDNLFLAEEGLPNYQLRSEIEEIEATLA